MNGRLLGSTWRKRVICATLALFLAVAIFASAPGEASAQGWGRVKQMDKFVKKIGQNVKEQSDLRFGDLAEALWAASSIAKMRGLGIITGYDGNVFKPNSPVTQAEALTMMVRAFDLEDEAEEMAKRFGLPYEELDKKSNKKGKDDYRGHDDDESSVIINGMLLPVIGKNDRWALGYILLAVEEGWVKLSECSPNKPATRAWISKVMVRALDHEAQAIAKMKVKLPFTDRAAVPADSVGYVAEAVAMGLFQGYNDGSFQPNKPVTRAEMATILERFLSDELPSDMPYLAAGTVTSVSSNKVALKTENGSTLTYTVSGDALIVVDGKPSTLSTVKVGDVVEVLSNGSGTALLITVKKHGTGTTPPVAQQVTGEIVAIAMPPALTLKISGQSNRTITLADDCSIKLGKSKLAYEQLLLGDVVKVTLQDNKATAIEVISRAGTSQKVTGVIQGITTSSAGIDLVIKDGSTTKTVRLASDVEVTYGTSDLTPADLRVNDEVEATVVNGLATRVKILDRDFTGDFDGTISSITHTEDETVIVVTKGSASHTATVTADTEITYGTVDLTRGDLRLGDVVVVTVEDDEATEIEVQSRAGSQKVTGVIQSISTTSSGFNVVVKVGTANQTLRVPKNVQVVYEDSTLAAADLRVSDEIEATVENKTVTHVKILDRDIFGDMGGTVTSVTQTATETVIVVSSGVTTTTVKVTPDTTITYGTTDLTRADLRLGDVLRIKLVPTASTRVAQEIRITTRGTGS
ncbi:MAG: S-layer homology domain-containing protein [Bacillota bacterium]